MNKKKIFFICDLNLANGGAQRNTIKTLPRLSKVFDIFLYMSNNPSPDAVKILDNLEIRFIVDFELAKENVKKLIRKEGIDLILIQYENPKWILLCHEIWKEVGINYVIFFHELPFINTPIKSILPNWYIHVLFKFFLSFLKHLFYDPNNGILNDLGLQTKKVQTKGRYIKSNSFFIKNLNNLLKIFEEVRKTPEGLADATKLIAMGGASKYYIGKYFGFKNIIEIEHSASSDIQSVEGMFNLEPRYDLCFMAARLESGKGIFDILDIVYLTKQLLMRDIRIAIMGRFVDPISKEQFNRKLKKLKLDANIILMGFVTESQKVITLCSSKVFVYPSRKDVFSISLANALYCGIPSVTYDLPFVQQFKAVPLFKIKYKDLKGMSKSIASLINMSELEPERFLELRSSIRSSFVSNFNWDKSSEEQIKAINCVLEEQNS
jgi:glycosyltransferase involved in cell wall biosynthesis